jgi:hypothetical protein
LKFSRKIRSTKIENSRNFLEYKKLVLIDNFYQTKLKVKITAKGTDFYLELPIKFKVESKKINGTVNETKIVVISHLISLCIILVFLYTNCSVGLSASFGFVLGFIAYLMLRKNVKDALGYFICKF